MVRVKICGITNLEDALNSVKAGAAALGFVFYKKSPRYIRPKDAKKVIRQLPKKIIKAGVFVNAKGKLIKDIAKFCKLDILQFHGTETPRFCKKFKGYKVVKAFRVKDKIELKQVLRYKTFAYLFDTFSPLKIGGTGKCFNWALLSSLNKIKKPIFLSGGLTNQNVRRAIKLAHPDWLDVSSSLELSPGKKDQRKVKEFIQAVRE